MIIFLDFDGVLHPQKPHVPLGDQAFCHLPRFENVVRDYPTIEIVISSTWREHRTLAQLRSFFSADLAHRIIGATPIVPDLNGVQPYLREAEILAWLSIAERESEPWCALDDTAWLFSPPQERLIHCQSYIGFDEDAEMRLREFLAENTS